MEYVLVLTMNTNYGPEVVVGQSAFVNEDDEANFNAEADLAMQLVTNSYPDSQITRRKSQEKEGRGIVVTVVGPEVDLRFTMVCTWVIAAVFKF